MPHSDYELPRPIHRWVPLDASGSSVAYFYFVPLDDDRHFSHALAVFQHVLELVLFPDNVVVNHIIPISRPGFVGVRSSRLAEDNNLVCHVFPPFGRLRIADCGLRIENTKI